jgi:probable 2-oxoglutarate dehydrogenase E1 component DHKTD1
MNEKYRGSRTLTHKWRGMKLSQDGMNPEETGYNVKKLLEIGEASVALPTGFEVHPRIKKMFIQAREKNLAAG